MSEHSAPEKSSAQTKPQQRPAPWGSSGTAGKDSWQGGQARHPSHISKTLLTVPSPVIRETVNKRRPP